MMNSRSRYLRLSAATLFAVAAFASVSLAQRQMDSAPLRAFAKAVQARIDKKELDITRPFAVEMDAAITGDGKLDRGRSKFTSESGDPKMVEVAKQAIYAADDSGYFAYAKQAGIDHARVTFSQTNETFNANVFGEQNAIRAHMTASALSLILSMTAGNANVDPNEKLILQNTRASAGDGGVNITCTLPAADFQRMILSNQAAAAPVN